MLQIAKSTKKWKKKCWFFCWLGHCTTWINKHLLTILLTSGESTKNYENSRYSIQINKNLVIFLLIWTLFSNSVAELTQTKGLKMLCNVQTKWVSLIEPLCHLLSQYRTLIYKMTVDLHENNKVEVSVLHVIFVVCNSRLSVQWFPLLCHTELLLWLSTYIPVNWSSSHLVGSFDCLCLLMLSVFSV